MDEDRRIADLDSVPEDGSVLFTVREGADEREAILLRDENGVVAFENYCQHWTDVRLDKGSGATVREGEVVCEKHAATFDLADGECTFGPCEGARLPEVEVTVAEGGVYLADDRYAFGGTGGTGDRDLSSGSRIGFSGN